jgi:hypothetical protein
MEVQMKAKHIALFLVLLLAGFLAGSLTDRSMHASNFSKSVEFVPKTIPPNLPIRLVPKGTGPSGFTTFTATSTITLTLGTTTVDQATADAIKAQVLLDYAKARNLAIYQSDGVTVITANVAPAVSADVKQLFKTVVVEYRANNAGQTSSANQRATDTAGIQP